MHWACHCALNKIYNKNNVSMYLSSDALFLLLLLFILRTLYCVRGVMIAVAFYLIIPVFDLRAFLRTFDDHAFITLAHPPEKDDGQP